MKAAPSFFQRAAQCLGKVRFVNPQLAWRAFKRSRAKKTKARAVYRCPTCNAWHMGTKA